MTPDLLVTARHATRTFGSGSLAVVAVQDVTCDIGEHEMIALTGPSGSGKTTLLHLLAGLDDPTGGSVTWPGMGCRQALRPGLVAVVFQSPSLLPALNVRENVALPLLLLGLDRASANEAADQSLALLDLSRFAAALPEELSGGQAQRASIARALTGRPRLILADEPTGQLDQVNAQMVVDTLIDAARRSGAALVVNTHDGHIARQLPQRWTMNDGRLDTTRR